MRREGSHDPAGFTLVELLVVCAIIVVISGIILANNNRFGGQVILQSTAYDVALSVRQAQVYGISVQRFTETSSNGTYSTFSAGYGVHFDSSAANNRTYLIFADLERSGLYDPNYTVNGSPVSEIEQQTNIGQGYDILALCVPSGATIADCTNPGNNGRGNLQVKTLDITYVRPEPDAYISYTVGGGRGGGGQTHACTPASSQGSCPADARIVLASPRGDVMSVIVSNNGQIAVDQTMTTIGALNAASAAHGGTTR